MNPYSELPSSAFWKSGVTQENPYAIDNIYKKKFDIEPNTQIATAGSCFAQHISRHLKKNGYRVIDDNLERVYRIYVDQLDNMEPRSQVVLADVEELKFEFLDGNAEWQENWQIK